MSAARDRRRREERKRAKVTGYSEQKQAGIRMTQRARYGNVDARTMFDLRASDDSKQGATLNVNGEQVSVFDVASGRAIVEGNRRRK